jgi:hypothetical protein
VLCSRDSLLRSLLNLAEKKNCDGLIRGWQANFSAMLTCVYLKVVYLQVLQVVALPLILKVILRKLTSTSFDHEDLFDKLLQ